MQINRRQFFKQAAIAGAGMATAASAASSWAANAANDKIVIGVMGTSRQIRNFSTGRGAALAKGFASLSGVEVAYICDVDERNMGNAIRIVSEIQPKPPKGVKDFRRILDDRHVDALVIAAPDHWHAIATILACQAGKHVYVEKPGSHNLREAELMVAAARKHKRHVQLGTQRRSMPFMIEAIEKVRGGEIGRASLARCWYFNSRPSIGRGKPAPVPEWLDYSLWQGPAPERQYRDNIIHYNWHWFWHWGTGELGNNGVHTIDACRWGLGVGYPVRVSSVGGRYRYNDDWETPDTNVVTYDFGDKMIIWEGRSCWGRTPQDADYDIAFYGDKGVLAIKGSSYTVYDPDGKEIGRYAGNGGDSFHLQNFLDSIRNNAKLNAEIEEGAKSAILCHLGNISYRVGRAINLDPKAHRIVGDKEAERLCSREYRPGWEPKV